MKKRTVGKGVRNLRDYQVTVDEPSEIPEGLAAATRAILAVHAANGDLAWVADMIAELEAARDGAGAPLHQHGFAPGDLVLDATDSAVDGQVVAVTSLHVRVNWRGGRPSRPGVRGRRPGYPDQQWVSPEAIVHMPVNDVRFAGSGR